MLYRRIAQCWIITALLFVLSACALPGRTLTELEQNRQNWIAHSVTNYRYTLSPPRFYPTEAPPVGVIEVRNGAMTSITLLSPVSSAEEKDFLESFKQFDTMEKLFDIVQNATDNKAYSLSVHYDPTFGFPDKVFIDYTKNIFDDETY